MPSNTRQAVPHGSSLLQRGSVVDEKYEILELISCGMRSSVYTCRHLNIPDQTFAIKILNPEYRYDSVAVSRFRNEVIASYGVNHFHVIRAFELLEEGDHLAFTMEYLPGGNLKDLISRESPIPIPEVITILAQIASGLQAIHEAGIMHRNLKPENILLTEDLDVRIADFGIARIADRLLSSKRAPSNEVAPDGSLDQRADLYSFGLLAYHLITGQSVVRADNPFDAAARRMTADIEVPSHVRSDCSPKLDEVVARALSGDSSRRYYEASEIFDELRTLSAIADKRINIRETVSPKTETIQTQTEIDETTTIELEELFQVSEPPKMRVEEEKSRFRTLRRTDTQVLKTLNDYLPAVIPQSELGDPTPEMTAFLQRVAERSGTTQLPSPQETSLHPRMTEWKPSSRTHFSRSVVRPIWVVSLVVLSIAAWHTFGGTDSHHPPVQIAMRQTVPTINVIEGPSLFEEKGLSQLRTNELSFLMSMLFKYSQKNGKNIHQKIHTLILATLNEAAHREDPLIAQTLEHYVRDAAPEIRARATKALVGSYLAKTRAGTSILASALRDKDYLVRGFSAKALGEIGSSEALGLLDIQKRKGSTPHRKRILAQTITSIESRSKNSLTPPGNI